MATTTQGYNIQVADGVDPNIATKLLQIATNATSANTAISQLQKSLKGLTPSNSLNQFGSQLAALTAALNTSTSALTALQSAATRGVSVINNINNSVTNTNKSINNFSTSLSSLINRLLTFAGIGISAKEITDASDAYTTLQNKLNTVADSQAVVNQLTADMFQIANQTGTSVESTTTAFTRFDRALQVMGKDQQTSLDLTKTVNEALLVSGATTAEASGAIIQLSQAFGAGVLQGQEFRSIARDMPILLSSLAQALNVPVSNLKALSSQGKITSSVLLQAFQILQPKVDALSNSFQFTVGRAIQVLHNNFEQFIGDLNQTTGIFTSLANLIVLMSQHLDALASILITVGVAMLAAFGPSILELIGSVVTAIQTLTVALLRNPFGIIAIAITGLLGVLFTYRDTLVEIGDESVTVGQVASAGWQSILTAAQPIIAGLSTAWHAAMAAMGTDSQTFLGTVVNLVTKASAAIAGLVAAVGNVVQQISDAKNGIDNKTTGAAAFIAARDAAQQQIQQQLKTDALNNATQPTPALRGSGPNLQGSTPDKSAISRAAALNKVNVTLDNEIQRYGLLGQAQQEQQKYDQVEQQLLGKKITLTNAESASIKAKIAQIVENNAVQADMNALYSQFVQPQLTYQQQIKAADTLLKNHVITQDDYSRAVNSANLALKQATDPLYDYNKQLTDQNQLLGLVGDQYTVQQKVQQEANALLQKGIDLYDQQHAALLGSITAQAQASVTQQAVQTQLNQIYADTAGATNTALVAQQAYANALNAGYISVERFSSAILDLQQKQALSNLNAGKGTASDFITNSFSGVTNGYTTALAGASNAFKDFSTSLDQGFADSIGKWLTGTESLGDALYEVAQNALGSLISALIKLGIQYLLTQALGLSSATATTAAMGVAGTATAVAWAPAAALASLATLGTNAAAATGALTATTALSDSLALSSLVGLESGGYTGNVGTKQIAGYVHGQEFVFNAAATRRIGVNNLQSMQANATSTRQNSSTAYGSSSSGIPNVVIHNYTGTPITMEPMYATKDEVAFIAKREVANGTDAAVAGHLQNPNSKTSKSLAANTRTSRRLNG